MSGPYYESISGTLDSIDEIEGDLEECSRLDGHLDVSTVSPGIVQLTQDVLAGPGFGVVPATVVGIHHTPVSGPATALSQTLVYDGSGYVPRLLADSDILGGWRIVADLAALFAIPVENRKVGMQAYVISTGVTYALIGGDLTNASWVLASSGGPQKVSFTFTTTSPLVLQAVTTGSLITRALISVTEVFDDPSATIKLGTTATPGLVLGLGDVNLSKIDEYDSDALVTFGSPDFLILTISPGISTVGRGMLYFWD